MSELKLTINPDGTAKIEFSEPPSALSADALSVIIGALGNLRGQVMPQVVADYVPIPGKAIDALPNPRWYIEPEWLGNTLLHIRDPRYGWLAYNIPKLEAKKLGEYLLKQASDPTHDIPGPDKAN